MILNLGCGNRPIKGAINQDKIKHSQWVDVAFDLNNYPWLWNDNTFDMVYAMDVLEHLVDFVRALEECHRILKPGGILELQVPNALHPISFRDPSHLHFFTADSMDYFIPGTELERDYGFYSKMRWKLKHKVYHPNNENIFFELEKI